MRNYTVEYADEVMGLPIVVVLVDLGHRCGYVGIPQNHPLYGIGCKEAMPGVNRKVLDNMEIGDRGIIPIFCRAGDDSDTVSPGIYFDVHGGITFAGESRNGSDEYPIPTENPTWWYGFDCAHCDDTPEKWTEEAVKWECFRFAEQLAKKEWLNV